MELHKQYTFEGTVPMRYTEEAMGLDRTYTLHFEAACALAATTALVTPRTLEQAVILSLQPAYMRAYPDGINKETLHAAPAEAVCAQALPSLKAALQMLGAEPEQFTVTRHWLGEEDAAAAAEAEKNAVSDEERALELFKQQLLVMRAKTGARGILWICECGTINDMNFCTECGKRKSFARWSCPCGNLNDNRFCTECGRKFE